MSTWLWLCLCISSGYSLPHTKPAILRRAAVKHNGKSRLIVKPGYVLAALHGSEDSEAETTQNSQSDVETITGQRGMFREDDFAVQLSAPMTLLHILNRCIENAQLQLALGRARERGTLNIHIIGANASLEPAMAWAGVLGGWNLQGKATQSSSPTLMEAMTKLASEAAVLSRDWQLPPSFADLNLHLVFSGFEHHERHAHRQGKGIFDSNNCHQTADAVGARAGRDDKVRITCLVGKYGHESVLGNGRKLPDLAVALHPGFGMQPADWEASINNLLDSGVPTLVTSNVLKPRNLKNQTSTAWWRMMRAELPSPVPETPAQQCRGFPGVDNSSMSDVSMLQRLGANIVEGYQNPFAYPSALHSNVLKNGQAVFFIGRDQDESLKIQLAARAKSAPHNPSVLIRDELVGMLTECKDFVHLAALSDCFSQARIRIENTTDFTCTDSTACKNGNVVPFFQHLIENVSCLMGCKEYLNSLPQFFSE